MLVLRPGSVTAVVLDGGANNSWVTSLSPDGSSGQQRGDPAVAIAVATSPGCRCGGAANSIDAASMLFLRKLINIAVSQVLAQQHQAAIDVDHL